VSALILGAGLSGLIAATQFPNATVYEANGAEHLSHRAVLRFRSDSLSRLTGIPFRRVTVRKSIWHGRQHVAPSIRLSNLYSLKTNGALLDRSIWHLDPVERFIAPEDLQLQMADLIGPRIHWHRAATHEDVLLAKRPIISTLPMPVLLDMMACEEMARSETFANQSITVDRFRIPGADVFQTIYFPGDDTSVYRASITGDLLIIESVDGIAHNLGHTLDAFGLTVPDVRLIDKKHVQRFGKIRPIDDDTRRQTIFNLSQRFGIYSLGRFAVWRNILLDDVVSDAAVVKRLISAGQYGAALHHSQKG